ncbi:hypothetical protein [Amycolatopsis sp. NPDC049868]|uniref:hypothetical protein n=1 Tax=Amycolatopsis sp. NPDC049868 TaxID=3363934 RepID=UPI00379ACF84
MEQTSVVHKTIVVVDIESFGDPRRTNGDQVVARDALYRVVEQAFTQAGVSWDECDREDRGDAVFVLAPALVPKAPFVEVVPTALATALREHNTASRPEEQIRLRMAVHAGEVAYDEHGVTAASVISTFRLVEAAPVKSALAQSPGSLALIVSPWFFDEVVRHSRVVDPATFRPVEVAEKETTCRAWIGLPDHPYPADPRHLADSGTDSSAALPPTGSPVGGATVTVSGTTTMRGSAIAGGNVDQSRRTRIGVGGLVLALVLVSGGITAYRIGDDRIVGTPFPASPTVPIGSAPAASPTTGPKVTPRTDAPTRFEPTGVPSINGVARGTVTLAEDRLLYITSNGVNAVDPGTGSPVGSVGPVGPAVEDHDPDGQPRPPAVVEVDGRKAALAAFPVLVAGSGTTPDSVRAELVAMDIRTGKRLWTTNLAVPGISPSFPRVFVAGATATTAVVVAGAETTNHTSYGVDLASREQTWKLDNFEAVLVDGEVVAGRSATEGYWDQYAPFEVKAANANSGAQLWTALGGRERLRLATFGPSRLLASDDGPGSDDSHYTILATATGISEQVPGFDTTRDVEIEACSYDGRSTTVCQFRGMLMGYDATSAALLWTLGGSSDKSGRLVPRLNSTWNGALYGTLHDRGPIVLDARTGRDKETSPGGAPDLVNEYAAIQLVRKTERTWTVQFLDITR